MLEFEIASIYYFISNIIEATPYFEAVPEDLLTPCVFYPAPEANGAGFSVSTFAAKYVLYVKFMDSTTLNAYLLASTVLQAVMKRNNKIPLVNEQGVRTGQQFSIEPPDIKRIDTGVYQMKLSWKRYTSYRAEAVPRAKEFFFNGNPVEMERR